MSSKGIFIIRAILSPIFLICSGSDFAFGIIELSENNLEKGITYLFLGCLLFGFGYFHAKKAYEMWRLNSKL